MFDVAARSRGSAQLPVYMIAALLFGLLFGLDTFGQSTDVHRQGTQPSSTQNAPYAQLSRNIVTGPLRVGVDLVVVPVTVRDRNGRAVTNLEQHNFAIYENDKEQTIRYFSKDDQPISLGLILDLSSSMINKIDRERAAVSEFLKAANSQDDYFVIGVSSRPTIISDSTQSADRIEAKLALETPKGTTALLDAVYLALTKMRSAQYQRRALLIISDGGDNNSRYRLKHIKELAQEADVAIYGIGLFDTALFKPFEEFMGRRWLQEITDASGGRTVTVDDLSKLPEVASAISWELRNEYVISYRPESSPRSGKKRLIRVKVVPPQNPELQLSYKRSYSGLAE